MHTAGKGRHIIKPESENRHHGHEGSTPPSLYSFRQPAGCLFQHCLVYNVRTAERRTACLFSRLNRQVVLEISAFRHRWSRATSDVNRFPIYERPDCHPRLNAMGSGAFLRCGLAGLGCARPSVYACQVDVGRPTTCIRLNQ